MLGSPRICKIIRALQVAKHYWCSETAKCGDCAVWRFSHFAKSQKPPKARYSQILESQKPPTWRILKFCKVRNPQSGAFSKTQMLGNLRICEIIRTLQVAKHDWLSETAKCGACAAWRFSNSAKVRNHQSKRIFKFCKVRIPQSGELSKTPMPGNPRICEIFFKKLYKRLSAIDFQKLQSARIARFGDFQILQSQKKKTKVGHYQILQSQKPLK